jgi:hypothetical protein
MITTKGVYHIGIPVNDVERRLNSTPRFWV